MSSKQFHGLSSTPNIVEVNGQKFFLCQLTGELSRFRAGIPGRNNSLSGTFCNWNAVMTYLSINLGTDALKGQLKARQKEVSSRAFDDSDEVYKIEPLPHPDKLYRFCSNPESEGLTWEEYVDGITLVTKGCQTIAEALKKIEDKKALRKGRESNHHSHGYSYNIKPGTISLKMLKDEPLADLLRSDWKSKNMPTLVVPCNSDKTKDFKDWQLYYDAQADNSFNELATDIGRKFLCTDDFEIHGEAIIFTGKKDFDADLIFPEEPAAPENDPESEIDVVDNSNGTKPKRKAAPKRSKKTSKTPAKSNGKKSASSSNSSTPNTTQVSDSMSDLAI
jgi:hypothetical protein